MAKDIEEALETGSIDKKKKAVQRLEDHYRDCEYVKFGKIGGGAFGEVYKG